MSIITVSRRSYSRGKEIAEEVARLLGYECIGREVLQSASREFGIPEAKLYEATHEAPSFLGMTPNTRKRCIAYVKAAFAAYMLKDNVVYHGPAGELLIHGVSHLLRVRIIADLEHRIALKMERENISEEEARKSILRDDKQHAKLMKWVYGRDDADVSLYDLVINLGQISVEEAVEIITSTVKHNKFQPMTYSIKLMENIELSCRVTANLIDIDPDIKVRSEDGKVHVHTKASGRAIKKNAAIIKERTTKLLGVKNVEVHMSEDLFERIAGGMR
ncbi:MAG: cytidylate kinase-like family protein [Candidatus Hydrogenedentota bacterium]|nr:MAG: cytidylate kinase-like family protein [Candidatus Hydrogenedentota bacterium]